MCKLFLVILVLLFSGCAVTYTFDPGSFTRNTQLAKQQQDDHAILEKVVIYVNQQIASQQQSEMKTKKQD